MSIDNKGKDSLEKPTQRSSENKPTATTEVVNRTQDKVEKIIKK